MNKRTKNIHLKAMLYFGLSGLLTGIAFINESLWPLVFVSNIPFSYFLMRASREEIKECYFTMIFSYAIMYYAPMMYWIYYLKAVIPLAEEFSVLVLTIGIALIVLQNALSLIVAFWPFRCLRTRTCFDFIIIAAFYVLAEWIQQYAGIVPFPWARLGLIVTPFLSFIQSASLFGVFFISFLVMLVNGVVTSILIMLRNKATRDKTTADKTIYAKKNQIVLITAIALLCCNLLYGAVSINVQKSTETQQTIGVLLVQGNHSGLSEQDITAKDIMADYIQLTKEALSPDTKLVIWPETSIPVSMWSPILSGESLSTILGRFCAEEGIEMIVGAFDHQEIDGERVTYNAMYYVTADGAQKQAYYKQKLVPFGEYLPYRTMLSTLFPEAVDAVSEVLSDEPGSETILMNTGYGDVGGIICYESIFPEIARESVAQGAKLFALISNDSWLGESSALRQHHSQAIMRAVENRRYVLRASNTGITSIISSTGEVLAKVPSDIPAIIQGEAVLKSQVTLFARTGHIIIVPVIIIWLSCLLQFFLNKVKQSNKQSVCYRK